MKLRVHIGTTCICIESHGVALESHLGLCDVFLYMQIVIIWLFVMHLLFGWYFVCICFMSSMFDVRG